MFVQGCTIIFVGLLCLVSAAPPLNSRQKRQTIFFDDELDQQGAPNQGTGISSASIADKDEWLSNDSRTSQRGSFGAPAFPSHWAPHDFPHEHFGKGHHGDWHSFPAAGKHGQSDWKTYPHKHGHNGGNLPHGGFPFVFGGSPQFHGGSRLYNSPHDVPSISDFAKGPVDETWDRVTRQTNNGPTSNNRPTVAGSWNQNQPGWNDIGNGGNVNNGPDFDRPETWLGNGQNNNGGAWNGNNQWSNGNGRGTGAWNGNQNWNGNNGWNGNQRPNDAWSGNGGAWNGNNQRPNGNNQNTWSNNNNGGSWNGNQRPNGNGNNQNPWNNNGGSWNGNNQRPNGNPNNQNSWNNNNNGGSWNGSQRPNGNSWTNNGGSWNGNNNRPTQNAAGDNGNFGNSIAPSPNNNNRPRPGGNNGNIRPPIAIGGVRPPSTPAPNCDCPATNETNPVCGTDGNTYINPSRLRCARTCGSGVQQKHYGACTATTTPAPNFRRG